MNFILEFNQEYENTTATELNQTIEGNRTRRSLTTKQLDAKAKLVRINLLREELAHNIISISYFLDSISKFHLADGEHAEVLVILNKCLKLFLFLTILYIKCYYRVFTAQACQGMHSLFREESQGLWKNLLLIPGYRSLLQS